RSEMARSNARRGTEGAARRACAGPLPGIVGFSGEAGSPATCAIVYAAVPAGIGTTLASEDVPSKRLFELTYGATVSLLRNLRPVSTSAGPVSDPDTCHRNSSRTGMNPCR